MAINAISRGIGVMLLSLFLFSCGADRVKVSLCATENSPVIAMVKQEIDSLFTQRLPRVGDNFEFVLKTDKELADGDFSYKLKSTTNKHIVLLAGSGNTEISNALYTFLEDIGYRFNITGVVYPVSIDISNVAAKGLVTVHPAVRWRGIRQHVNFPMDISSYPIGEAKAYVRDLLRMRFNKLAFHSYPNQWYKVVVNGKTEYAGHFFYGNRHPIPQDVPVVKDHIRFNKEYYVIPEIEPVYLDEAACSDAAVKWMAELTSYAKELGFFISMSADPNGQKTLDDVLNVVRFIGDSYPAVDQMELISEEMGGWGSGTSREKLDSTFVEYFGQDILKDTLVVRATREQNSDLENLIYQTGRNIRAITTIKSDPELNSRFSSVTVGSYCTNPDYTRAAYYLARKFLPESEIVVLPAHGSRRVADFITRSVYKSEDMAKAIVYSWIEFDGLMFLQQNCVKGIHDLIVYMQNTLGEGQQANALLFNHWRTAENRTAARYAALATLYGPVPEDQFYRENAQELGISDAADYHRAMRILDDADWDATNDLPNIGFCWVGAWDGGGSFGWMPRDNVRRIRAMYDESGSILAEVLRQTSAGPGHDYLEFLCNRIACTVVYLNAFEAAGAIQDIKPSKSGVYTDAQKGAYVKACNEGLLIFDQYLDLHTRMMPDRGTEGTLINTWLAPIRGLKILRNKVGGVSLDDAQVHSTSNTAPPLPIFIE